MLAVPPSNAHPLTVRSYSLNDPKHIKTFPGLPMNVGYSTAYLIRGTVPMRYLIGMGNQISTAPIAFVTNS